MFWILLATFILAITLMLNSNFPLGSRWLGIALCSLILVELVVVYAIQPQRRDEFEAYTKAINDIEIIGNQLSTLVGFLKKEQRRVIEAEETYRRLESEKTELEPVVRAQRETVNAILSAHAKTAASKAWKERALGFVSGLIASLLAAIVFEYLRP